MKKVVVLVIALWFTNASAQTDSVFSIEPQSSENVILETYQPPPKKRQLPQVVLKANAGYGRRIGIISDELSSYQKDFFTHLMSGFTWDVSCDFFFKDKFGIRAIFYQYRTSHSELGYNLDTGKDGILNVKDQISYFGPAFVFRLPFGHNSWRFDAHAGMGYLECRDKQTFAKDYLSFYGATLGTQMGAGLEYKISPQLGVGINVLITSGTINTFHYDKNGVKSTKTYEIDKGEGLFQIKIGAGIRYYIK